MQKQTFPFLNNKLFFSKKDHIYRYENKKIMSVTHWVSSMFEPFNPYKVSKEVSENPNSQYYGMDPAEIRILWSKTAGRGIKKHDSIEKWLNEIIDTCDESDFLINLGITPKTSWSEIPLFSKKLMLSGTSDIITQNSENDFTIWDIKTSEKIGDEKLQYYSIQMLVYCLLLLHMTNKKCKISPGGIILISPQNKISEGVENKFKQPQLIEIDKSVTYKLKKHLKERKIELKKYE